MKKIYNKKKDASWSDFVRFSTSYATLFIELKSNDKAIEVLNEGIDVLVENANESSDEYITLMAEIEFNLATISLNKNQLSNAEKSFKQSLEKRKMLMSKNYSAYLPSATQTQHKLGLVLLKSNRLGEAEEELKSSLENSRKLVKSCPEAFLPLLTESLNTYGELCYKLKRYPEAGDLLKEALIKRRALIEKCKEAFLPELVDTLNNCGMLCFELHKNNYEKYLNEASEISHALVEKYHEPYVSRLFYTLVNLEKIYGITDPTKSAEISKEIGKLKEEYPPLHFN